MGLVRLPDGIGAVPKRFGTYAVQNAGGSATPPAGIENRIWIIDTGIAEHPDLSVDKAAGWNYSVTPSKQDATDDNGHGTHIAGIAAGKKATQLKFKIPGSASEKIHRHQLWCISWRKGCTHQGT